MQNFILGSSACVYYELPGTEISLAVNSATDDFVRGLYLITHNH